jgi:hypothetical protein
VAIACAQNAVRVHTSSATGIAQYAAFPISSM